MKTFNVSVNLFGRAVLAALLVLMVTSCVEKSSPSLAANPNQIASQPLPAIKEMAKDQNRQREYRSLLVDLLPMVSKQVHDDPQMFLTFLQDMVDVATKTNAGLAIQMQGFADEITKRQMAEKQKLVTDLQLQIKALKPKVDQLDQATKERDSFSSLTVELRQQTTQMASGLKEKDATIAELQKKVQQLQEVATDRDELASQLRTVRAQFDESQRDLQAKTSEIAGLKQQLNLPGDDGVSVCVVDDWFSDIPSFLFINKQTGQRIAVSDPPREENGRSLKQYRVVQMPIGDYHVEIQEGGKVYSETDVAVTKDVSASYDNKWYHCVVKASSGEKTYIYQQRKRNEQARAEAEDKHQQWLQQREAERAQAQQEREANRQQRYSGSSFMGSR